MKYSALYCFSDINGSGEEMEKPHHHRRLRLILILAVTARGKVEGFEPMASDLRAEINELLYEH